MSEEPEELTPEQVNHKVKVIHAPPLPVSASSDSKSLAEEDQIEADQKVELAKCDLADRLNDVALKRTFPRVIVAILVAWLLIVVQALYLSAIKERVVIFWWFGPFDFELGDSVLVALVAGCSANIIGAFTILARYLFPSQMEPRKKRGKRKRSNGD